MTARHGLSPLGFISAALLLPITQPAAAQSVCPPMTPEIAATHTRPPTGDELLHQYESASVDLKIVIRRDGTSDVNVESSSGISALNERALTWVRDHWRWPKGCAPDTTRRETFFFVGW